MTTRNIPKQTPQFTIKVGMPNCRPDDFTNGFENVIIVPFIEL